ncbi:UNC-like C-terminal-domain-containing protein [Hyaloraphidium curvatum]|nr:UNC-like C-terminal-domain-containing protein [Hyaloraphidium curvatum]
MEPLEVPDTCGPRETASAGAAVPAPSPSATEARPDEQDDDAAAEDAPSAPDEPSTAVEAENGAGPPVEAAPPDLDPALRSDGTRPAETSDGTSSLSASSNPPAAAPSPPPQASDQAAKPVPSAASEPGKQPVVTPVASDDKRDSVRFNYASSDCGASIVGTNREASHASAILSSSRDSYMLNKCAAADKHVIVELCEDVLVDALAVANFEIFSSNLKDFNVLVRARPAEGWKLLGTFRAANTRDVQLFRVPDPKLWARFVRLDVVSFYGRELFCPISLLRVHGRTMLDELKEEEAKKASDPSPSPDFEEMDQLLLTDLPDLDEAGMSWTGSSRREQAAVQRYSDRIDYGTLDATETEAQRDFLKLFHRHFSPKAPPAEGETPTPAADPPPTDSVFRSMWKRLSAAERNITSTSRYLQEEVQVVNRIFGLVFRRLSNITRTLQMNDRRGPDRFLLRNFGEKLGADVTDDFLRQKLSGLEQEVQRISLQLMFFQLLVALICLGCVAWWLIDRVPKREKAVYRDRKAKRP